MDIVGCRRSRCFFVEIEIMFDLFSTVLMMCSGALSVVATVSTVSPAAGVSVLEEWGMLIETVITTIASRSQVEAAEKAWLKLGILLVRVPLEVQKLRVDLIFVTLFCKALQALYHIDVPVNDFLHLASAVQAK